MPSLERSLELIGYYLVMLLVVFGVLEVITRFYGEINFWVSLVLVILVVLIFIRAAAYAGWEPHAEP